MYYKTKRTSETGKKFQAIDEKGTHAHQAAIALAKEHGFTRWRPDRFSLWGGISSIDLTDPPKNKLDWKKGLAEGEYMPSLRTKKGKELAEKIEALPKVGKWELNACIGYDERWNNIGFRADNEKYFGFTVSEKWEVTPPDDCEEITFGEFKELFERPADHE